MMINTPALMSYLRKRKLEKKFESKPIGTAIRYKRKEMNMTLEEAAEGICSVSYLSKLENNQIEMSDKFSDQLLNRFDIEILHGQNHENYLEHIKAMLQEMLHQIKPKINYTASYENRIDQYSLLIKLMYQHLLKEDEKKQITYKKIQKLIYAMNHEEAAIVIIIASETLYKNHFYQESYDILRMIEHEDEVSKELIILKRKMIILNACKLHRWLDIITYKEALLHVALENQCFKIIREINLTYLFLLSYYKHPKTLQFEIKNYEFMDRDFFLHLKANSYYYHQDPQSAIDCLSQMKKRKDDAECLYLLCLERLNRIDELKLRIELSDVKKIRSRSLIVIKKYFKVKYKASSTELFEYVRNTFLTFGDLTDDFLILKYLQNEVDFVFTSEHHYKDALASYKRFTSMIDHLKTALLRDNNKD
jgi:HTH-type transcriptional regulator, quorum sensing regulator NprR